MRAGKGSMVKRFGARYGSRLRKKVQEIEMMQRSYYVCPMCGRRRVRRAASGIWRCLKCGYTFAGGAWSPMIEARA